MAAGRQALVLPLLQYENPEAHEHAEPHQTAVNIPAALPNDHIIWSLISFVHGNPLCLGLAALIYSIKARDRKLVGDLDGARRHASTARVLNIVATVLACIVVVVIFTKIA